MDQNVVDCELAERDTGLCVCKGGPTLEILKDIQRLYEEKMEHIEKASGPTKLQMQVEVLRAWVGDLVGQNTLLARAVEELETEATTKLLVERRRNSERSSKNIVCGKVSELKLLNEALQKENIAKDREIRQLNKDAQTYEQTIMNLRKEMSSCKYHTPEVAKKDAEVMAGMCCTGREAPCSFNARTSTPNVSVVPLGTCATSIPNVSVIERSTSAPILASDASVGDLYPTFKLCTESKNLSPRASTSSGCSRKGSPRSSLAKETKECKRDRDSKKKAVLRCVRILSGDTPDSTCVEQLYFNEGARNSGASSPRGHYTSENCCDCSKVKDEPSCCGGCSSKKKSSGNQCSRKVMKDSGATCSLADSATSDANARATYYQNKLLATQQILQNKEDMIGVQADSLAVAEERIATLNERANELKRELEKKNKEYSALRKSIDCCKVEKTDVSCFTDRPMGCTCGLIEENKKLKEENEALRVKLGEFKEKLCEVECALASRKCNDMKYKADIEARNIELSQIKEELMRAQENSNTCEAKATQIRHMQELLDDKTAEMSELRQTNESLANKIQELETELKKADLVIKENCKMRSEVSYLTAQVSLWRAQLDDAQRRARAADAELAAVRDNCAHIDACYRQKAGAVTELREHLEAAHARGTALCGEARHAVCAVRHWIRQLRDKHREQENVIKQKDCIIKALQRRLEERQSDTQPTSESENAASCSKCLSSRDEHSCCSGSKAGVRLQLLRMPRNSDMPGCSTSAAPIRLLKKRFCASKRCPSWVCDMGVQEPTRRDAGSDAAAPATFCRNHEMRPLRIERNRPRDTSPTEAEELLARVGKLAEALEDGHRRWTRRDPR
ncbi:uncharacterized protein LOC110377012 [Helicoverpa armigera]|uniref:uncharacterized protein LOC110377012 n=1 Tax=Helicoverpa armigera TaxID=29058 RepID=UPI003083CFD6